MKLGTWVFGQYVGDTESERFPQLRVRTGEPNDRSPGGYEERLDFKPFSVTSGVQLKPLSLEVGHYVAVRVYLEARQWSRAATSDKGPSSGVLVSRLALEMIDLGEDAPNFESIFAGGVQQ